jgi:hypothetical protein
MGWPKALCKSILRPALLASRPIGKLMRGIARDHGLKTQVLTEMWKKGWTVVFQRASEK